MVPSQALQGKVSRTFRAYNNLSKLAIKSKGSQVKPYMASQPLIEATTLVQPNLFIPNKRARPNTRYFGD